MDPKIILYQDGPSRWWPHAIKSFHDWCDAEPIMISQKENCPDGCQWVDIADYMKYTDEISKKYLRRWNELAWLIGFQRFVIMDQFVRDEGIERFFTFDSDFLLFCDPIIEAEKFKDYDFTLSMGCGTHDMFWNNMKTLHEFTCFCNEVIDKGVELNAGEKTVGSFSDMHALGLFRAAYRPNVGEMTDIRLGITWDNNLKQRNHHYDYAGNGKNILFKKGIPYCRNNAFGTLVRFAGLHVSSYLKEQIADIYREARCSI